MNSLKKYSPIILLLTVSLGLFARVLSFELLRWDDLMNTTENPWVINGAFGLFWQQAHFGLFIPVLYSVWAVIYKISSSAWAFHGLNWILHSLNVVLVYQLIKLLFPRARQLPLILGALVFCCHPLQVESVAWVTGARDLLSASFALAAVLVFLRADKNWKIAAAALLFALGLLCKPTIAPLPIALFIWTRRRSLFSWFALSAVATWATISIQSLSTQLRLSEVPFLSRLFVGIDSLGFYLTKFLAPVGLAVDYGRTPQLVLENNLWLGTGLVLVGIVSILVIFRKRIEKTAWLGPLLCLTMLLPVLGIIPFQAQRTSTVTDHYFYLSMVGVSIFLTFVFDQFDKFRYLFVAVLIGWSAISFHRLDIWQTNENFFTDMWEKNPKSYGAAVSLGVISHTKGQFAEAEKWLRLAHEIQPQHATAIANLASVFWSQKQTARISSEIEPYIKDPSFVSVNQEETKSLAALYLLVARTQALENRWQEANDSYCKFYRLDYENEGGKTEIIAFLQKMKSQNLSTDSCGDR